MTARAEEYIPVLELKEENNGGDEEILRTLHEAQRVIFKYPIASQAIIAALAAEGRRFSGTAEGRLWREHLSRSVLYRRGKEIWYLGTSGVFGEESNGTLPSAMVEAFIQAATQLDVNSVIELFTRRRDR